MGTRARSGGLRTSPGWALAVLAGISTCGFIDRIIMQVLVEPIKAEFRLTDQQIGLLTGLAFALLNVGLGLYVARLAERRTRTTLVWIGTLLWSAATAACGLANSFGALALARVSVGVGEAVGLPATYSIVADHYPRERRASAMAVLLLAPPIGAFLGSAAGATIAGLYGWRAAFWVAAAPGVLLAMLLAFTVAEPPRGQHDADAGDEVPPLGEVIARFWRRRSVFHLLAGSTVASLAGFGLNAFLAAYLLRRFGFTIAQAGVAAGLISSVPAALSVVGAGWIADRWAPRNPKAHALLPAWALVATAPLYILAVTRTTPAAAITLLGLVAFVQYCYLGTTSGAILNQMHPRMRASASAISNMIYSLVGAGVGPLLIGSLSDHFGARSNPAQGLTDALAATALIYWWGAIHYFLAARTLPADAAAP